MKNIVIFLSLFFILSSSVLAASTATVSGTKTATPSATITPSEAQNLEEKIKSLVKENLDATESNLQEKINQRTLVGYSGNIQSITSDNFTLSIKNDGMIQVTTDEKTEVIKVGADIKISAIALSDKVIVIGTLLKDDIISAKRVIVVKEEENPMISSTIVAKVSSIDVKKKTVSLTIDGKEVIYTLTKKSTIKIDEIKPGETLFAITKKYEGKDYLSRAKVI